MIALAAFALIFFGSVLVASGLVLLVRAKTYQRHHGWMIIAGICLVQMGPIVVTTWSR